MGIVRVQKNSNYSVMSNVHLQDESLSWKAKGILSYLLSKPDNWQVYVAHLKNQSTDGRDATASGIRELIDAGYIARDYSRNEAGQITGRNYVVHEAALEDKTVKTSANSNDNPKTENPLTVKPTTVEPKLLNTDYIKDRLKKNTDDVSPKSPSLSKSELIRILASLMALVPEQHQQQSVKKTIEKGLGAHTKDYIRAAIAYTALHSNGDTTAKFKAYLGQSIDNGWADGWEPEPEASQVDQDATRNAFEQMPDDALKMLAGAGNQFAADELSRRKK